MNADSAFSQFPARTTARLHLRQVTTGDAEGLFAIKSDPNVTARYGREPHQSIDDTLGWIERLHRNYHAREGIFWVVTLKADGQLVGSITLWNIDPDLHGAELGYELHPGYWRNGYMTEAAAAALAVGFEDLGLHRIEALPLRSNAASQSLLHRLGFTLEGVLRERVPFRGQFFDELMYSLLRTERVEV